MHSRILWFSLLGLTSCVTSGALVEPDWTTYPVGKLTETPTKMWVAPGYGYKTETNLGGIYQNKSQGSGGVTYDFISKEVGDTAEKETFIVPKNKSQYAESKLFELVPARGQKLCAGDYRISQSKYYFGDEATVRMSGITTPALKVKYRCPVYYGKNLNEDEKYVRELAGFYDDFRYFDVLSKSYPIDRDDLFVALKAAIAKENMPIRREGKKGNAGRYIVAGKSEDETRWGRIEQITAVVRPDGPGSMISFELLSYQLTYHTRGVLSNEPSVPKGASPWDRKVAYVNAKRFLSLIDQSLPKSK